MTALFGTLAGSHVTVAPGTLGRLAARALRDEATLTPKPGLVDMRGGAPHDDMDVTTLLASADALTLPITSCAEAAASLPLGRDLRAEIGAIGRAGEQRMLGATGGVNTHRGALWVLGLLAAGPQVSRRGWPVSRTQPCRRAGRHMAPVLVCVTARPAP
jgi:triphosphoribosyl-dephospho-CoA synthetase